MKEQESKILSPTLPTLSDKGSTYKDVRDYEDKERKFRESDSDQKSIWYLPRPTFFSNPRTKKQKKKIFNCNKCFNYTIITMLGLFVGLGISTAATEDKKKIHHNYPYQVLGSTVGGLIGFAFAYVMSRIQNRYLGMEEKKPLRESFDSVSSYGSIDSDESDTEEKYKVGITLIDQ
jgi:hypothetical protein